VPGKDGLEEPIIHVEVGIEPSEGKTGNSNVNNGTVNVTSQRRDLNAVPEAQIAELAVNHTVHKVEVKDDINQAQNLKKTNTYSSFYYIFATDSTATYCTYRIVYYIFITRF
jgi:hypothetical protein